MSNFEIGPWDNKKTNLKKIGLSIAVFILIVAISFGIFFWLREKGALGSPENHDSTIVQAEKDAYIIKDFDNDGLSDIQEKEFGTNPNSPDTDNDGYPDKLEIDNGYNPLLDESSEAEESILKPTSTVTSEEIDESQEIIKTKAGDEYGIDLESLVATINYCPEAQQLLKSYDSINVRIGDRDSVIELEIGLEDGKVQKIEDGLNSAADITFIAPLDTVIKITNDYENLTAADLLKYALTIKTEPSEAKQQLLKEVLKMW